MSNSDIITIKSLNDYITVIKEHKLSDYFYRGENDKYPTISSSILRKGNSLLLKKEKFNFYEDIVNEYYDEIATNISEFDRKNFLAFSQHHGLLTNLVDLTSSPLVALYFACTNNMMHEANKNTGYVYLFDKKKTIDVSKLISDFISPPANSYNIISLFRGGNTEIIDALVSYFNMYFWDKSIEPYLSSIFDQCSNLSSTPLGCLQVFFDELVECRNIPSMIAELLFEKSRIKLMIGQCSNNIGVYINLLHEFFNTLTSTSFLEHKGIEVRFPNIPYFIYKTPYKFDRIRNQEGLFLYQLYHVYATEYEDVPNALIKQEIIPDLTLIIDDKKTILEELDFIGVNLKNIYGDFDNIATYYNDKHFKYIK